MAGFAQTQLTFARRGTDVFDGAVLISPSGNAKNKVLIGQRDSVSSRGVVGSDTTEHAVYLLGHVG